MEFVVYKNTKDNWYPPYTLRDTQEKLVGVSFLEFTDEEGWGVCVWGADDCGMEKIFARYQENLAWTTFLEVIGLEYVSKEDLIKLGFESA